MTPVFGLHTHARSNAIRSGLLILALFLLIVPVYYALILILVGTVSNGRRDPAQAAPTFADQLVYAAHLLLASGPVLAVVTTLVVVVLVFRVRSSIDRVTGAIPADPLLWPGLQSTVETLCISRGMPAPPVHVMPGPEANAFASGIDPSTYAITVTEGLLDLLDEDEIEAVLAHELTHIRNGDVALMVTATVIVGFIEFFADRLLLARSPRLLMEAGRKRAAAMAAGVLILKAAGFLARPMAFAVSRRREFLADAGALELTKNPDALIRALMKLQGRSDLERMPFAIRQMCFCNVATGIDAWFSTHPPVEKRIEALIVHAGGRLPDPADMLPPTSVPLVPPRAAE